MGHRSRGESIGVRARLGVTLALVLAAGALLAATSPVFATPANLTAVALGMSPDDMPAHIKSMLNGLSLHVPVAGGKMALGTWQGIYVAEHRAQPHRREVVLQFLGSCAKA